MTAPSLLHPDDFFVIAMQQKHGISNLHVTTRARFTYEYIDETGMLVKLLHPVLCFSYANATIEKAMPMRCKQEWVAGSTSIAMARIVAECAWSADDVDNYIGGKVADLRDNLLVKGDLK